jgi:hypothetical protein
MNRPLRIETDSGFKVKVQNGGGDDSRRDGVGGCCLFPDSMPTKTKKTIPKKNCV